ncbi:MAG: RecX family transcriptional regulator [Sphingomonadales bacterium]|nr:RecX family transcriptional regulator [Sphingomonadales bacterium]MBD3772008.1 RecX family transcriptional regulator [Paracoccaceae bacterium]
MSRSDRASPRKGSSAKPLDSVRLEELALAYVARFATSRAKLSAYLSRKLRDRGWAGEAEPPVTALVERYADLGYVDDAAYARAKAGGLLRRGYGARRVEQALGADGIEPELREELRPGEVEARRAALSLARRRRFGPFGGEVPDRARREKQIAAMLRAGHVMGHAAALIDAASEAEAEQWLAEAEAEAEEL